MTAPRRACTVVLPAAKAVAWPREPSALLTSATVVSLDVQVTKAVTSIVDPSLNVPAAVNATCAPTAADGFAGRSAIAVSVADDTVTVALPDTPPSCAVTDAVPAAAAATSPLLAAASLTVATPVLADDQVAARVTSRLVPSEYRPVATSASEKPAGSVDVNGVT